MNIDIQSITVIMTYHLILSADSNQRFSDKSNKYNKQ